MTEPFDDKMELWSPKSLLRVTRRSATEEDGRPDAKEDIEAVLREHDRYGRGCERVMTKADGTFSDWLRACAGPLWPAMVEHRFTRDMAADSLPSGAFENYLKQEHAFVRQVVTVIAHALIKAPTPDDQRHLTKILVGLTVDQESYFQDVLASLGLAGEPDSAALPPAALALGEGVLAVAAHGRFEEVLSMMLAAEWMYLEWCTRAAAAAPQRPEPARWIAMHADGGFADGVAWTRGRLDELGPNLDQATQLKCARHFRRMLELEIAFHDAVYAT